MERKIGTVSRGVRCPIIREGDALADIVVTSVLEAAQSEGFELRDRDIVAVTESVVARSQGNRQRCRTKIRKRCDDRCDLPDPEP